MITILSSNREEKSTSGEAKSEYLKIAVPVCHRLNRILIPETLKISVPTVMRIAAKSQVEDLRVSTLTLARAYGAANTENCFVKSHTFQRANTITATDESKLSTEGMHIIRLIKVSDTSNCSKLDMHKVSYLNSTDSSSHTSFSTQKILKSNCTEESLFSVFAYGNGNSENRGYFSGYDSSKIDTVDSISYIDEATTVESFAMSNATFKAGTYSSSIGYYIGGQYTSGVSSKEVDCIVFSSRTKRSNSLLLSLGRYGAGSVIDRDVTGYYIGGHEAVVLSKVDAITFATESFSNIYTSIAREYTSSIHSYTMGYFINGINSLPLSNIERINFSSNTIVTLTSTIMTTQQSGLSSDNVGYLLGGYASSPTNTITGINFTDETNAVISSSLSETKNLYGQSGSYNNAVGYIAGGMNTTESNAVEKLKFADSTCTKLKATISTAKKGIASTTKDITKHVNIPLKGYNYGEGRGYICGGYNGTAYSFEIDGILTTTDVAVNPSATLAIGKSFTTGLCAISEGYICGGDSDNKVINDIEKFTFAVEAAASVTTSISKFKQSSNRGASSNIAGYVFAGYDTDYQKTVRKLIFDTEISNDLTNTLTETRCKSATVYNKTDGYICGGYNGVNITSISRFGYINEASSNITSTFDNYDHSGLSSPFCGYYFGGNNNNSINSFYYSVLVVSPLSVALSLPTKNASDISVKASGYMCGGMNTIESKIIEKLQYDTETKTVLTATLFKARSGSCGLYVNYISSVPQYTRFLLHADGS